jgi:hypothetical protein
MTLIAAWITPEFRIVASDSRLLNANRELINGDHQKVFANKLFSLGLYGSSLESERKFIKDFLYKNPNAEINDFKKAFEMELCEPRTRKPVFKLVAIPQKGIPEIWSHRVGEKLIWHKIDDYKRIHQPVLPEFLFFNEQELDNNKIDTNHQEALLSHFNKLKATPLNKLKIFCDVPVEVQIIMRLIFDAMNEENKPIYKRSIGGNKVFYAYSYDGQDWFSGKYPEDKKVEADEEILNYLSIKLENDSNQQ